MTQEEIKAQELIQLFWMEDATQCAIICVEEIIGQLDEMRKPEYTDFWHGEEAGQTVDGYAIKEYWQSVLTILKTKP